MGYITSSAAPVGMLGDLLASAVNANVGAWVLSPVASEIEAETVRWIAELIGYPVDAGGLLVSGGNMANLTAFWAARAAVAGAEVRSRGMAGAPDLTVYCSEGTHTWVEKASDLAGLGTDAVRWIRTDPDGRMDLSALEEALDWDMDQGRRPMMVVGTGGSVGIGAVDDMEGIAALCRSRGIWFHVDGAYGGLAAMLPDAPEGLRHLALADSVAVDPHKWLYAPLEAGCVLVRDPAHLRQAFAYHPPYFHFGEEATNYLDLGPQNSRGFRALKIWLALQQVGRTGYEAMLSDDIRLAGRLFEIARDTPELEAFSHNLSIATFRYLPAELADRRDEPDVATYLDELNERLQSRLEAGGEVFLSNAILEGRYLLRGCIVNFRTSEADVRAIPAIVAREGAALHRELGGPRALERS
jgi:glutamate/tyrosine decarboxylase-like PLP-dependent enzyme